MLDNITTLSHSLPPFKIKTARGIIHTIQNIFKGLIIKYNVFAFAARIRTRHGETSQFPRFNGVDEFSISCPGFHHHRNLQGKHASCNLSSLLQVISFNDPLKYFTFSFRVSSRLIACVCVSGVPSSHKESNNQEEGGYKQEAALGNQTGMLN